MNADNRRDFPVFFSRCALMNRAVLSPSLSSAPSGGEGRGEEVRFMGSFTQWRPSMELSTGCRKRRRPIDSAIICVHLRLLYRFQIRDVTRLLLAAVCLVTGSAGAQSPGNVSCRSTGTRPKRNRDAENPLGELPTVVGLPLCILMHRSTDNRMGSRAGVRCHGPFFFHLSEHQSTLSGLVIMT